MTVNCFCCKNVFRTDLSTFKNFVVMYANGPYSCSFFHMNRVSFWISIILNSWIGVIRVFIHPCFFYIRPSYTWAPCESRLNSLVKRATESSRNAVNTDVSHSQRSGETWTQQTQGDDHGNCVVQSSPVFCLFTWSRVSSSLYMSMLRYEPDVFVHLH